MAGVPNVFANASVSIPLIQLDQNFNTQITLGNSTMGLGNTTNLITPNSAAGIVGTTAADNPAAGSVGEFVENTIASGSAVAYNVGSGNPQAVMTLSLSAGDWDVEGVLNISGAGTPSNAQLSFNSSAAQAANQYVISLVSTATAFSIPGPRRRFNANGVATIYMVATIFNPQTNTMYGYMNARRVR